jgi:membrane protease YdiL (CAAX protease family)
MKTCSYCGKEYPEEAERCAIDGESLQITGTCEQVAPPLQTAVSSVVELTSPSPVGPPAAPDGASQFTELVLVCMLAFGSSILTSFYSLAGGNWRGSNTNNDFRWLTAAFHEATMLGLVAFLLARRGLSFRSLGLKWSLLDIPRSAGLWFVGAVGHTLVYGFLKLTGLALLLQPVAVQHVSELLFAGEVSVVAVLFQFLNPFFEELIVRAYVITAIKNLTGKAGAAILVSAVLQTSYHFYQGVPLAISDFAPFLVFSVYYARTNRIAPLILAHLYFDLSGTLYYYWTR